MKLITVGLAPSGETAPVEVMVPVTIRVSGASVPALVQVTEFSGIPGFLDAVQTKLARRGFVVAARSNS